MLDKIEDKHYQAVNYLSITLVGLRGFAGCPYQGKLCQAQQLGCGLTGLELRWFGKVK